MCSEDPCIAEFHQEKVFHRCIFLLLLRCDEGPVREESERVSICLEQAEKLPGHQW